MPRRWKSLALALVVAGGTAVMLSVPMLGQSQAPAWASGLPDASVVKAFITSQTQKNWVVPRTPWGDPNIQGNFTSKDGANTPFERPNEWAGRRMEDITPDELAEDDTQIIHKYACHEGNYGLANLLSAARAEERQAGAGRR